jgi:acyl transferase domain-containing protein
LANITKVPVTEFGNVEHGSQVIGGLKLLVLSAFDNKGIRRMQEKYKSFLIQDGDHGEDTQLLDSLAFTLAARRSHFPWRSFMLTEKATDMISKDLSAPVQSRGSPCLTFVFTGQGAQYPRMGQELMIYPVFRSSIDRSAMYLRGMGCCWSLQGK